MGLHHIKELLNKGNNQNHVDADVEETQNNKTDVIKDLL